MARGIPYWRRVSPLPDASSVPRVISIGCVLAALLAARSARAIRPFVTDDARVVGKRLGQVETWMVVDRIQIDHNLLAAIGPTDWIELTAGFVQGAAHRGPDRRWGITGPILQSKILLKHAEPNGLPGVAIAGGVLPPWGTPSQRPLGVGLFTYLAVTESLWNEALLVHANLGHATADLGPEGWIHAWTAGLGAQVRVVAGLHAVGEIYKTDPYDPKAANSATQLGVRYVFSDQVQIDWTYGSTLGRPPGGERTAAEASQWSTLGLRLVSPELW